MSGSFLAACAQRALDSEPSAPAAPSIPSLQPNALVKEALLKLDIVDEGVLRPPRFCARTGPEEGDAAMLERRELFGEEEVIHEQRQSAACRAGSTVL